MRKLSTVFAVVLLLVSTPSIDAGWRPFRGRSAPACSQCQPCSATSVSSTPVTGMPVSVPPAGPNTGLDATNVARINSGLSPLGEDADLSTQAAAHAANMAASNRLYHVDGRIENVAYGARDAAGAIGMWLRSPGHRANMLLPSVSRVGIGMAYSSGGVPYWCAIYSR